MFSFIATPFGYVMRFIYQFVGSYGLSIILFSLLAKLLILPLSIKSKKSMMDMQRIQPKLLELQKRYGKDRQKYAEEMQKLYDNEGVSMTGGCLPTLLTFPVMFGLYYVISQPLSYFMQLGSEQIAMIADKLGFVVESAGATWQIQLANLMHQNFDSIAGISDQIMRVDFNFLGMNLAATPSFKDFSLLWLIPVLSGLTAFLFSWMQQKLNKTNMGNQQTQSMNTMMMLMMPLMSVYFGFILPAGLGIYWISNNVFSAVQELVLTKYFRSKEKTQSIQGKS